MELIVRRADGTETTVQLKRAGGGFEVTVGDRTYLVDRVAAGPAARSYLIDGRQIEVSVRAEGERRYVVTGRGGIEALEVIDPLTLLAEQAHAEAGVASGQVVEAYMPGRVAAILVEEGAAVEAGEGVLVLEAMKMENEIQTEASGIVTRLLVESGQAVEGGDPLFEIGPPADA